jgi:hypothetical protein
VQTEQRNSDARWEDKLAKCAEEAAEFINQASFACADLVERLGGQENLNTRLTRELYTLRGALASCEGDLQEARLQLTELGVPPHLPPRPEQGAHESEDAKSASSSRRARLEASQPSSAHVSPWRHRAVLCMCTGVCPLICGLCAMLCSAPL